MSRKYFPLIATIFVFILVSNLIGYIPLPINTGEKFLLFGRTLPSFQIYAADTNVAVPLMLALLVFVLFNYERCARARLYGFLQASRAVWSAWADGGPGSTPSRPLSNFLRLISLTVRLWANLLAGHLLIAFMGGELGGTHWAMPDVSGGALLPLGVAIFLFEAVLIAGLQAFIFAILTAIYLGSAVARTLSHEQGATIQCW